MSQNLNSVTLLKIPKDLAAAEHQAVAAHIQASDIDGISIGYLGGAWGPEWDQDTNYDLSFLELYAGISGIEIHLPAVTDLSPLSTIAPNLRFVNLGEFKSAKVSLASLAGCSKVELLSLNRVKKDFEVVSELGSITDLYLTGYGPKQIASISRLSSIKNLYLGFGTMADLFEIAGMTSLLNLELMWIKKLHDLEAIKQLAALETLKLANLKQVIKLPDLSGLGNFRSLGIDTLNGLESLDGIRRCGLEELAVPMQGLVASSTTKTHWMRAVRHVTKKATSKKRWPALTQIHRCVLLRLHNTFDEIDYVPARISINGWISKKSTTPLQSASASV